jgi:hypothetical protein
MGLLTEGDASNNQIGKGWSDKRQPTKGLTTKDVKNKEEQGGQEEAEAANGEDDRESTQGGRGVEVSFIYPQNFRVNFDLTPTWRHVRQLNWLGEGSLA